MDVSVDVCVWGGHLWAFAIKSRKDVMVCSFVHDGEGGVKREKRKKKKCNDRRKSHQDGHWKKGRRKVKKQGWREGKGRVKDTAGRRGGGREGGGAESTKRRSKSPSINLETKKKEEKVNFLPPPIRKKKKRRVSNLR